MIRASLAGGALAASLAFFGCGSSSTQLGGPNISDPGRVGADASPGTEAMLVLGGTKLPVELRYSKAAQDVRIEILASGQPVEVEQYLSTEKGFSLAMAAGETYRPPIELLRFPLKVGDSWTWKGTMQMAAAPLPAEAKITTSSDKVYASRKALESVKVEVELQWDSGNPQLPARRKLTFWFAPQRGVIKRDFASASARMPREE